MAEPNVFPLPNAKLAAANDTGLENRYGSGNGGGDDMQGRVAKLESDVEHIKNALKDIKEDIREIKRDARSDFRILFGALISVALGLAGLMAKGFHWL
ncbi:hypothetical protein [uncultured Enterobacter sp.]|uniref:hypothetical protein n=1 Tax=uncultured Enterobacter sp. TaxID=238202 RepID=UPI0025888892|nr:hypothetical protein [uncultured Enterobacter sp.]